MGKIDWIKLKNEYINSNISYRKLAEKYNISFNTLKEAAIREQWYSARQKQRNKIATNIQQKTAESIVKKETDRINRILSITDKILDKIEIATEQIDNYIVSNKIKVKKIEYDPKMNGKVAKETITETENLEVIDGIIDRLGLKHIANALKDIKDIQDINKKDNSNGQLEDLIKGLKDE